MDAYRSIQERTDAYKMSQLAVQCLGLEQYRSRSTKHQVQESQTDDSDQKHVEHAPGVAPEGVQREEEWNHVASAVFGVCVHPEFVHLHVRRERQGRGGDWMINRLQAVAVSNSRNLSGCGFGCSTLPCYHRARAILKSTCANTFDLDIFSPVTRTPVSPTLHTCATRPPVSQCGMLLLGRRCSTSVAH